MKNWSLLFLLCAAPAFAQGVVDDSDLSGPASPERAARLKQESRQLGKISVFSAEPALNIRSAAANTISGTLMLADRNGKNQPARLAKAKLIGAGASADWTPVGEDGKFSFAVAGGMSGSYKVRFSLDNRYWAFHNPNGDSAYEWETEAGSSAADLGVVRPDPASENGKLGVLHLTYLKALDFLQKNGDVDWWKDPLTVNIPGSADFFSPWAWSLDLTNPLAWDIVTHELGHAVQHGAMKAASAGGSHKIDECYSDALAWSEGWGTFFAAAVNLDPADPDAKFEYLVPRRAPIRIENVPDDVCKGTSSEWRVFAGLWDLYDTHADGRDDFSMSFKRIWKSLRADSTDGMPSVWTLIAKDLNPVEKKGAEGSLIQNTLLAPAAPMTVSLPRAPADWVAPR